MCRWTKYNLLLGDLKVDLLKEIGRVDLVEPTRLFSHSSQIMDPIIQWNCRGFKINFIYITLFVQAFLPIACCLQDSFTKSDNITLRNYSVYSIYVDDDGKAAGGSTILRDSILHSYVNLDTDLQAVGVCISLDKTITLCSV